MGGDGGDQCPSSHPGRDLVRFGLAVRCLFGHRVLHGFLHSAHLPACSSRSHDLYHNRIFWAAFCFFPPPFDFPHLFCFFARVRSLYVFRSGSEEMGEGGNHHICCCYHLFHRDGFLFFFSGFSSSFSFARNMAKWRRHISCFFLLFLRDPRDCTALHHRESMEAKSGKAYLKRIDFHLHA